MRVLSASAIKQYAENSSGLLKIRCKGTLLALVLTLHIFKFKDVEDIRGFCAHSSYALVRNVIGILLK